MHVGREGCVVWFTGLSGSGKTTLARATFERLTESGWAAEILDADLIRPRLCKGLGYSPEDRVENIRRIAFVAGLLARHGVIALVPAIAPYRSIREELRLQLPAYLEVYVDAPLAVCEARDPKGLYRRARSGEIANFTGITDAYEPPETPDVLCQTDVRTAEECVEDIVTALDRYLSGSPANRSAEESQEASIAPVREA